MRRLLSIHVPKTAGTSFRRTLESVYGKRNVFLIYDLKTNLIKVPNHVQVVHGHIDLQNREKFFELNPKWREAQKISWVRSPEKRFISNYFYFVQIISDQLSMFPKTPDLKDRMLCTLEEFLSRDRELNDHANYMTIDEINAGKFQFIGRVENYEEDLFHLAQLLGWSSYDHFSTNRTSKKKEVELSLLNKIKDQHKLDFAIIDAVNKRFGEKDFTTYAQPKVRVISNDRDIVSKIRPYLPANLRNL